jgi:tRNA dimethylallyltransferase
MASAMPSSNFVLVLVGPTASGKTALLDELFGSRAERRRLGLPEALVISADSMQAYRGMDIGTAKPSPDLLERLPHRLIDIRDVKEQYTVGDFVRLADEACAEAAASGLLPIVSGGTGYYVRNFICGLPSAPAADPELRAAVARDLAGLGIAAMRAELAAADPESAARIHENDQYRLTRALEIVRATGRPLGDFAAPSVPRHGYRMAALALEPPPGELGPRIDARVDAMMAAGLPAEVESLLERGCGPSDPGMKAIGYREFLAGESDLGAVARAIKRDTRSYAKRQMTFFRALPGVEWIPAGRAESAERLAAVARSGLAGL